MCVTGNKYLDLALGVAVVAVTAGAAAPAVVPAAGMGMTASLGTSIGAAFGATSLSLGTATAIGAGTMALGGGLLMQALTPEPPDYSGYTPAGQQVALQQFNSQHIATTGSGGRQASASLAEAITRSKKRKLSQADVSDLSIDTSSFASTGLQFA